MSSTLFVLGKDRELSLAELAAVYPGAAVQALGADFVMLETPDEVSPADFNRLGGVLKVARLIGTTTPKALEKSLMEVLCEHYKNTQLNYGISLYGLAENRLRTILIGLKKALKAAGVKSRFANQGFRNLSAAQHKGLKGGVELLVVPSGADLLVAEVTAVQDIDAYSYRDYQKPFRSMRVGMLPPKLAQILVNLTGLKQGTLWDPFCGGGVLLMEAMLAGFDVLGSDIDEDALQGARRNVGWLQKEFSIHQKADLFLHDATVVLKGKKCDAIVCEGYLGPPQTHLPRADELQSLIRELTSLYVRFFEALRTAKFKGPVVIAMPFFRLRDGRDVFLDEAVEQIEALGFERKPFLPKTLSPRDMIILKYARDDQAVGRAIYRFKI